MFFVHRFMLSHVFILVSKYSFVSSPTQFLHLSSMSYTGRLLIIHSLNDVTNTVLNLKSNIYLNVSYTASKCGFASLPTQFFHILHVSYTDTLVNIYSLNDVTNTVLNHQRNIYLNVLYTTLQNQISQSFNCK